MRKNTIWILVVLATALIEMTWLKVIMFQGVLPNLVLVTVVFFAVVDGEERAMYTAVLGGLFQDMAGDAGLGHHILCLVLVGYFIGRIGRRLLTENPAVKVGLVFISALVHGFIFTCVQYVQHPQMNAMDALVSTVVPVAFYTALISPLLFLIYLRLFRNEYAEHGEPS